MRMQQHCSSAVQVQNVSKLNIHSERQATHSRSFYTRRGFLTSKLRRGSGLRITAIPRAGFRKKLTPGSSTVTLAHLHRLEKSGGEGIFCDVEELAMDDVQVALLCYISCCQLISLSHRIQGPVTHLHKHLRLAFRTQLSLELGGSPTGRPSLATRLYTSVHIDVHGFDFSTENSKQRITVTSTNIVPIRKSAASFCITPDTPVSAPESDFEVLSCGTDMESADSWPHGPQAPSRNEQGHVSGILQAL